MNSINLVGRLTRDVEARVSQNGNAMARFTLAVDRGLSKQQRQEAEQKGQPTADFISCIAFGKTAELITNYFAKGGQMGLQGRIQTGSYENKEGQRVYTTDVVVDRVHFVGDSGRKAGGYTEPKKENSFEKMGMDDFMESNDDIPF